MSNEKYICKAHYPWEDKMVADDQQNMDHVASRKFSSLYYDTHGI